MRVRCAWVVHIGRIRVRGQPRATPSLRRAVSPRARGLCCGRSRTRTPRACRCRTREDNAWRRILRRILTDTSTEIDPNVPTLLLPRLSFTNASLSSSPTYSRPDVSRQRQGLVSSATSTIVHSNYLSGGPGLGRRPRPGCWRLTQTWIATARCRTGGYGAGGIASRAYPLQFSFPGPAARGMRTRMQIGTAALRCAGDLGEVSRLHCFTCMREGRSSLC